MCHGEKLAASRLSEECVSIEMYRRLNTAPTEGQVIIIGGEECVSIQVSRRLNNSEAIAPTEGQSYKYTNHLVSRVTAL